MYLVVSSSNGRDSTVPCLSPRILTNNAKVAHDVAEQSLLKDSYFTSSVTIWKMTEEERYDIGDSSGTDAKILVCVMWINSRSITKDYYHDFEEELKP